MLKNIILAVSLLLNIALYTWAIDSMQYKKLIDSSIETWKNIVTNEKLKDVWTVVTDEVKNWVGQEIKSISDQKQKTLQEKLNEKKKEILNK